MDARQSSLCKQVPRKVGDRRAGHLPQGLHHRLSAPLDGRGGDLRPSLHPPDEWRHAAAGHLEGLLQHPDGSWVAGPWLQQDSVVSEYICLLGGPRIYSAPLCSTEKGWQFSQWSANHGVVPRNVPPIDGQGEVRAIWKVCPIMRLMLDHPQKSIPPPDFAPWCSENVGLHQNTYGDVQIVGVQTANATDNRVHFSSMQSAYCNN